MKWSNFFFIFLASSSALLSSEGKPKSPPLFSIGVGPFNVSGRHLLPLFQAEYKWRPFFYQMRPQAGALITTKYSTYFYGGIAYDFFLGKGLVLTPSFSPGIYFQGKGKELGFPLEFRSALELAIKSKGGGRLGGMCYHISNASLGHRNPGVNAAALFYSIPIGNTSSSSGRGEK